MMARRKKGMKYCCLRLALALCILKGDCNDEYYDLSTFVTSLQSHGESHRNLASPSQGPYISP